MRLLTISALLIAICAIFLGVGQSEETAKIDDVKEITPIETDLTDAEKEEKLPDSFESDESNNDDDEEEGKGEEDEGRGEVPEEENRADEKEDENHETDSSSLSENEVNDLEETLPDTEDTAALSKRSPWGRRRRRRRRRGGWGRRLVRKAKRFSRRVARKTRRFGRRVARKARRFVRRVARKARRFVRKVVRKSGRFGQKVFKFGTGLIGGAIGGVGGAIGGVGNQLTNRFIDETAKKLKYMKKKMGKTCSLIKVSAGLEAKIPQLSWECQITEQKMSDEENAGVQSDEAAVHTFREEVSENDLARIREFEAKELETEEVPQPHE